MSANKPNWRDEGVRIVRPGQLGPDTAQTLGQTMAMKRLSAITHAPPGVDTLKAENIEIPPNAKSGAHHHGPLESIICVVSGRARMRWGERLEYAATAGPGDLIFIPPWVPHEEFNASSDEALHCVLLRDDQEPVTFSLDIESADQPEEVRWPDPHHPEM